MLKKRAFFENALFFLDYSHIIIILYIMENHINGNHSGDILYTDYPSFF